MHTGVDETSEESIRAYVKQWQREQADDGDRVSPVKEFVWGSPGSPYETTTVGSPQ